MRNTRRSATVFVLALMSSWTIATMQPAHAYVDPGTGGMITQMLLAMGVGVVAAFVGFRRSIASFLRRVFGRGPKKSPEKTPS